MTRTRPEWGACAAWIPEMHCEAQSLRPRKRDVIGPTRRAEIVTGVGGADPADPGEAHPPMTDGCGLRVEN